MMLQGKVALVTGGGRGLGAAIVRVLAREGASVAINYAASAEKAEALVAEIQAAGGNAAAFHADVRDEHAVFAMIEQVVSYFGRLDAVINNALGGRTYTLLDDTTPEDYTTSFDFGCQSVIATTKAARPYLKAAGGGRIVNIVTELWNRGMPGWSVYLAGKGAMVGVSRSLAAELGPENITVNMVAPGWMLDEKVDPATEAAQAYAAAVALRRQGSAEEIGKACAFFLSDYASFITGAYLPVTGGHITQMGA